MMSDTNLPTWTSVLDIDSLEVALEAAEPGLEREAWRKLADGDIPSPSERQRRKHLQAAGRLLEVDDAGCISDSPFLACFRARRGRERHDLVRGAYLATVPLARKVARDLWRPAFESDSDMLEQRQIDQFLARSLTRCAESTFNKTRSTLLTEFDRLGVIDWFDDEEQDRVRPRHYQPSPVAFAWLLWWEAGESGREELPLEWAATESLPVAMFLCERRDAMSHLEWLGQTPLASRSQILGTPRIVFSSDADEADVWDTALRDSE